MDSQPKRARPRVALVLGSGAARGYAHIGVIDALEARGYEIVAIAGTSMGAVVGGIYAAGKLDDYRAWVQEIDGINLLRLLDPAFRLGAIQGNKVFDRIRTMIDDVTIESLPIEFTAVATDITNQQEVWFRQGLLSVAMRASAAIPSLFTPVLLDGRMLLDGALLNPLPITPVLSSRSDLVIAVNLNGPHSSRYQLPETERGPDMRERIDNLISALESRLRFRRIADASEALAEDVTGGTDAIETPGTQADPEPGGDSGDATQGAAAGTGYPDDGPTGGPDLRRRLPGPTTTFELINLSLEVMQNTLTQYKIAGSTPHILINVPKRICRPIDFHRAAELIAVGRRIADDTLDVWEAEQEALARQMPAS